MTVNNNRPSQPGADPLDANLERLLRSALDGPARPMSAGQIQQVLQQVTSRSLPFPAWVLLVWFAGLVGMALAGVLLPARDEFVRILMVLVPAINLAAAPIASLAIIFSRRKHHETQA